MKTTFIFIISFILITGCRIDNIKKVGFIIPERDRFIKESEFFKEKISALGCEPHILTTGFDADEQLDKGLAFLNNEDIDLLIIAPVNGNTIAPLVRDAKNKGVPVIAYNMLINNVEYDAFVTGDNQHLAQIFCLDAINTSPHGNYVILGGDGFDRNGVELKKGIEKILKPYVDNNEINIIYNTYIEGWSSSVAKYEMKKVINAYGNNIDVILSCNDDMADGIIELLQRKGGTKPVYITGQDASITGLKNVLEGRQTMTVYHPAKKYGYNLAELSYSLLQSKGIKEISRDVVFNGVADIPTIKVKSVRITKENLKKELIDTKIISVNDIY